MSTRIRRTLAGAVVALSVAGVTGIAAPAAAAPADSPAMVRAYQHWIDVLEAADCEGSEVAALYTRNGILLATFKDYVQGRADITRYFDDLSCKDGLTVTTGRMTARRAGAMGYVTGLYTFAYTSIDGTRVTVPARMTFVFVKRGDSWLIANHHSSQEPTAH
ncbi:MAG: nuclear transport factor 2 family protein [Candidatus Nanopelagicales bacterium]